MDYSHFIILLLSALLILLFVRYKQSAGKKSSKHKNTRSSGQRRHVDKSEQSPSSGGDWMDQVSQSVSESDNQDWGWDGGAASEAATAAVSAQEVDPLTEYQVYKQFGYETKAAASLASYLNNLKDGAPEKLVHELIGLSLRTNDIDLLSDTLDKYGSILTEENLAEYVKAGLTANPTHLPLRVMAEGRLGWGMQEVSRIIGEKTGFEDIQSDSTAPSLTINTVNAQAHGNSSVLSRNPLVTGNKDLDKVSSEEMGAVIGFVKPEKSARILKGKVDYQTALHQYNKAIQKSSKPASLIIDALKLDYQHEEVNQFAKHLWKLYYSLGQYGRQVKERIIVWAITKYSTI
ncbi:Uncharacterised protein [Neisseria zoodegmatis]|uniref:Uncharacterized protein n=1 Tax=Neisseria zoodegmatis TaxID=326523 RepID=A0A378WGU1_9NEIS|nr:Uncharacterised protein [Neisseria zoodegmatis]